MSHKLSPELDFSSQSFDPVKALKSKNMYLPYPKAKTYDNLSEWYNHTFGKKKNVDVSKKASKNECFVLRRNYEWFYETLGLDAPRDFDMNTRYLKSLPKKKRSTLGKRQADKLIIKEMPSEMLQPMRSSKIIVKRRNGTVQKYIYSDSNGMKKTSRIVNAEHTSSGVSQSDKLSQCVKDSFNVLSNLVNSISPSTSKSFCNNEKFISSCKKIANGKENLEMPEIPLNFENCPLDLVIKKSSHNKTIKTQTDTKVGTEKQQCENFNSENASFPSKPVPEKSYAELETITIKSASKNSFKEAECNLIKKSVEEDLLQNHKANQKLTKYHDVVSTVPVKEELYKQGAINKALQPVTAQSHVYEEINMNFVESENTHKSNKSSKELYDETKMNSKEDFLLKLARKARNKLHSQKL